MVRLLVFVMAIVVMAGLFFVLRPDPRAAGSRGRTFEVSVADGAMTPRKLRVGEGDRVAMKVDAAESVLLHIHGYGVELEAGPEYRTVVAFDADLTGRFGIEDHRSERDLGVLVVNPR